MKTCKDCKKEKPEELFYGVQGECKECTKARTSKWAKDTNYDQKRQRQSKKRIFQHRYSGMKARSEGRAIRKHSVEGMELLSYEAFLVWCESKKSMLVFEKLYLSWKESGFKRALAPSIDRIDNSKGYTKKNIQWLTLADNIKKDPPVNWKDLTRNKKGQFIKNKIK